MFTRDHIQTAIHWWCSEHAVDPEARNLLLFLFETLDTLYVSVLQFPESWAPDKPPHILSSGTHSMYINLPLLPEALSLLRASIGLSGDAFCIAKCLSSMKLENLNDPLSKFLAELERFRAVRNFFSHLDQRLANPDKHGITGSLRTNCGIEYISASGCFHLQLLGNVLHFTDEGHAREVDLGKRSFTELLAAVRPTFSELASHIIHKQNYHYPEAKYIYAT